MVGAIIGDIVGSTYENNTDKSKDIELFQEGCHFSDDTVLTVAVAKTLLDNYPIKYTKTGMFYVGLDIVDNMLNYHNKFKHLQYGPLFDKWCKDIYHDPYYSYGNGAAMRISPVGWICNSIEEIKLLAKTITEVTHNHPNGLKGAEAIAICIYLARVGKSKEYIKQFIIDNYYPNIKELEYDNLLKNYKFDMTCEGSVPQAIYCFLISEDFEDCLRTAVSIGGDTDTIAAMSCSIAEAFYKDIPYDIISEAYDYLPDEFIEIISKFNNLLKK